MGSEIEWGDYVPFDPGIEPSRPLHEVSRPEARQAFRKIMAEADDRVEQLRHLLALNGVEIGDDDESIQELDDWFRAHVERAQRYRLEPWWYAVVNDIALFLGGVIIARNPERHWKMVERPTSDVSYQRHVIGGFPNGFTLDVDLAVAGVGIDVTHHRPIPANQFVRFVHRGIGPDAITAEGID